ncbi:murein DD-endopeptidase MepM/ murein hydrolase activator NlpD [Pedobacter sp. UYEF25]
MKHLEGISSKSIRRLKIWLPIIFSFYATAVNAQGFNSIIQLNNIQTINITKRAEITLKDSIKRKAQPLLEESKDSSSSYDVLKLLKTVRLPLLRIYLTSGFGLRTHPVTKEKNKFHSGIDLSARNDTVYSILHGIVSEVGYNSIVGNFIRIAHANYSSIYGHLSLQFVEAGQFVAPGSPLGITGKTGRVTGEHLHFSIKYKNKFIDPLPFLYQIMNLNGNMLYYTLLN